MVVAAAVLLLVKRSCLLSSPCSFPVYSPFIPHFPFPYTHTAIDGCRVSSGHGCCELPTVYLIDAHTDRYTLDSWLHNACELGRGSFEEAEQERSGASEGRRLMQDLESHCSKIFLILYKSKKRQVEWTREGELLTDIDMGKAQGEREGSQRGRNWEHICLFAVMLVPALFTSSSPYVA